MLPPLLLTRKLTQESDCCKQVFSRSQWYNGIPMTTSSASVSLKRAVPLISSRRRILTLASLSPAPPREKGRPAHSQTSVIVEEFDIMGALAFEIPRRVAHVPARTTRGPDDSNLGTRQPTIVTLGLTAKLHLFIIPRVLMGAKRITSCSSSSSIILMRNKSTRLVSCKEIALQSILYAKNSTCPSLHQGQQQWVVPLIGCRRFCRKTNSRIRVRLD